MTTMQPTYLRPYVHRPAGVPITQPAGRHVRPAGEPIPWTPDTRKHRATVEERTARA